MSDNIRNKAISEIKIAKIAQNRKFGTLQTWLWRCTMGMFLLTLQKIPVSIFYSYQDLAWAKHKFKKIFFAKTSTIFGKIEFWFFCCTTSEGMSFMDFFLFCTKGSGRYGSDKVVLHMDRRTDGHTRREEQNMSRAGGRHIIITSLNIDAVYPVDGTMFILNGL